MADISNNSNTTSNNRKSGRKIPKLDMTPMVDLAFLLLTFFVLTATFNQPKTLKLVLPSKERGCGPHVNHHYGITLIMGDSNRLYWYKGRLSNDKELNQISYETSGLRSVLRTYNSAVIQEMNKINEELRKDKNSNQSIANAKQKMTALYQNPEALVVVVKNQGKATYKNVVDIVDELKINQVASYFIVDEGLTPMEKSKLEKL